MCLNYHHITELNNLLTMQNDFNPMLLMVDLTNESFLSVWSVVIAMYVYIALFLTSDLDYLVAIRTSSYISWKIQQNVQC